MNSLLRTARPAGRPVALAARVSALAVGASALAVVAGAVAPPAALAAGAPPYIGGTPDPQHVGVPVSFDYYTSGAPTCSVTQGALPAGVTLDPIACGLRGTPTLGGLFTFTVTATNSVAPDANVQTTLEVDPLPAAQVTGIPGAATAGSYYSFQFGWTGSGTPAFSVSSGQLPRGLLLLPNGALFGTPQDVTPGTQFTVAATDGVGAATEDVTLVVNPSTPTISGSPTMATRWISYSWAYHLTGIPRPTTTVTSGSLPPGLTLGTDGYLSGVPSASGHYDFTVTATNGSGNDAVLASSIDVSGGSIALHGLPPSGTVGSPYSYQFDAEGYPAPTVTVTVTGSVPPGLTVSTAGLLAGTPTTAGTYTFTLLADNGVDPSPTWTTTVQIGTSTPTVSIEGHRATEGNRGTKPFTFTVSLSSPSATPVTVHWATANGSAKAGSDYVAGSGSLTFAPGQTTRTVTVLVEGDRTKEPTESFTVRLSRPGHAVLGRGTATGTIVDDD